MENEKTNPQKPEKYKRKWYQPSLATSLAVMTILGVGGGLGGRKILEKENTRRAVATAISNHDPEDILKAMGRYNNQTLGIGINQTDTAFILENILNSNKTQEEQVETIHKLLEKGVLDTSILLMPIRLNEEKFKTLIKAGADPNAEDKYGRTPLRVSPFLIDSRSSLDYQLDYSSELLKLLIEAGADPNAKNKNGETALHSHELTPRSVKLLLDVGADPNAKDKAGNTPLHLRFIRPKNLKLLLEAGADTNTKNNRGETPLHCATNPECTKLLLEAGADPNAQDKLGRTPLHDLNGLSAKSLKLLLEAGADPNAKDKSGKTPRDYAHDPEVIKMLLEAEEKYPKKPTHAEKIEAERQSQMHKQHSP